MVTLVHTGHLSTSLPHLAQAQACRHGNITVSILSSKQILQIIGLSNMDENCCDNWSTSSFSSFSLANKNTLIPILYGSLHIAHWFSFMTHWIHAMKCPQGMMTTWILCSKQILQVMKLSVARLFCS